PLAGEPDRHPVRRGAADDAARRGRLRLRRRERPRPVPDPARRARRGRRRPARDPRRPRLVPALRALCTPALGRRLARRLGRDLEPALEPPPAGWTSADAAGLPILPGLARYDEVARGAIRHAIRFTAPRTRRAY